MNLERIRSEFPFFTERQGVVYLDNACMSLKPQQVIDAMREYYDRYPGCAGRSAHKIASEVDAGVADSRTTIRKFLGAKRDQEIVFTRNTTEAINIVASGLSIKGSIVTSDKEHNSNLVPWLRAAKRQGAMHVSVPTVDGVLDQEAYEEAIEGAGLVAINHVSNLDGHINDVKKLTKLAQKAGARVLIDGAQAAGHMPVDVRSIGADYYVLSGHKMLGPSGTGVLYGTKEALELLEPLNLGGHTVDDSWQDRYELAGIPDRFEAGLGDYAGIIGLGAAARYADKIGTARIHNHTMKLSTELRSMLSPYGELLGAEGSVVSIVPKRMDAHELSRLLSGQDIMTRSGAFCVHSWFNTHDKRAAVRLAPYLYNTADELQSLDLALRRLGSLI